MSILYCKKKEKATLFIYSITIFLFILSIFLFNPNKVYSAEVELAWNRNNDSITQGYVLHYGTRSRSYSTSIDVGNRNKYLLQNLPNNQKMYFAVTAYDVYKRESSYSQEVVWNPGKINLFPIIRLLLLDE